MFARWQLLVCILSQAPPRLHTDEFKARTTDARANTNAEASDSSKNAIKMRSGVDLLRKKVAEKPKKVYREISIFLPPLSIGGFVFAALRKLPAILLCIVKKVISYFVHEYSKSDESVQNRKESLRH